MASRSALSRDLADIMSFIAKYRDSLDDDTYNSLQYSVKLIQIPKISNTNRADAAIEFVRWDALNQEDRNAYEKLSVIIKDKTVRVEAANLGRLKPSDVVRKVNEALNGVVKMTSNLHVELYKLFSVRPPSGADDPFETVAEFCLYDEAHSDYVYQEAWVVFLVHFMQAGGFAPTDIRKMVREGKKLDVNEYRS